MNGESPDIHRSPSPRAPRRALVILAAAAAIVWSAASYGPTKHVYSDLTSVPLPELMEAGATIALGADDPLLFGSRLEGQYATMRAAHDLTDEQLAELARMSIRASCAPDDVRKSALDDIDAWLALRLVELGVMAPRVGLRGPRGGLDQRVQSTRTGSLTSRMPKRASTPSRTSRARASSSVGGAVRRGWSGRACAWWRGGPGRCRSPCGSRPARSARPRWS